jgi:hypothetical protein
LVWGNEVLANADPTWILFPGFLLYHLDLTRGK